MKGVWHIKARPFPSPYVARPLQRYGFVRGLVFSLADWRFRSCLAGLLVGWFQGAHRHWRVVARMEVGIRGQGK